MNDLINKFPGGRRNAVITLFIPKDKDFKRLLKPIERQVLAIKHANKRGQIKRVLYHILWVNKDVRAFLTNVIICCGYDLSNKLYYQLIETLESIDVLEYYYDYTFHYDRINEVLNQSFIKIYEEKEETELVKKLRNDITGGLNDQIVYGITDVEGVDNINKFYTDSLKELKSVKKLINSRDKSYVLFKTENGKQLIKEFGNLATIFR